MLPPSINIFTIKNIVFLGGSCKLFPEIQLQFFPLYSLEFKK